MSGIERFLAIISFSLGYFLHFRSKYGHYRAEVAEAPGAGEGKPVKSVPGLLQPGLKGYAEAATPFPAEAVAARAVSNAVTQHLDAIVAERGFIAEKQPEMAKREATVRALTALQGLDRAVSARAVQATAAATDQITHADQLHLDLQRVQTGLGINNALLLQAKADLVNGQRIQIAHQHYQTLVRGDGGVNQRVAARASAVAKQAELASQRAQLSNSLNAQNAALDAAESARSEAIQQRMRDLQAHQGSFDKLVNRADRAQNAVDAVLRVDELASPRAQDGKAQVQAALEGMNRKIAAYEAQHVRPLQQQLAPIQKDRSKEEEITRIINLLRPHEELLEPARLFRDRLIALQDHPFYAARIALAETQDSSLDAQRAIRDATQRTLGELEAEDALLAQQIKQSKGADNQEKQTTLDYARQQGLANNQRELEGWIRQWEAVFSGDRALLPPTPDQLRVVQANHDRLYGEAQQLLGQERALLTELQIQNREGFAARRAALVGVQTQRAQEAATAAQKLQQTEGRLAEAERTRDQARHAIDQAVNRIVEAKKALTVGATVADANAPSVLTAEITAEIPKGARDHVFAAMVELGAYEVDAPGRPTEEQRARNQVLEEVLDQAFSVKGALLPGEVGRGEQRGLLPFEAGLAEYESRKEQAEMRLALCRSLLTLYSEDRFRKLAIFRKENPVNLSAEERVTLERTLTAWRERRAALLKEEEELAQLDPALASMINNGKGRGRRQLAEPLQAIRDEYARVWRAAEYQRFELPPP